MSLKCRAAGDYLRFLGVFAVVVSSLGCASLSPSKQQLAQQFIADRPPSRVFRRITEDLALDQAVLEAMRKEAELGGESVLAVVELQRGVHPYSVFVFVRNQSGISLRETAIYWGRIQLKRHVPVSQAEFASLNELALRTFKCQSGAAVGIVFGAGYITWTSGSQVTCGGEWLSADTAPIIDQLERLMVSAAVTYEEPSGP